MRQQMVVAVGMVVCAAQVWAEPVALMPEPDRRPVIVRPDRWVDGYEANGFRILQQTLEQITAARVKVVAASAVEPLPGQIWLGKCELSTQLFAEELQGLDNVSGFDAVEIQLRQEQT